MHESFRIDISIEHHIDKIYRKFKKEIDAIEKNKGDRKALFTEIITMGIKDFDPRLGLKDNIQCYLPIYYLLKKSFGMAWITKHYLSVYWSMSRDEALSRPLFHEAEESWNPELYLENYTKRDSSRCVMYINGNIFWDNSDFLFSLDDPEVNEAFLKKRSTSTGSGITIYDERPEARYVDNGEEHEYAMNYDSHGLADCVLPILMRFNKHAEAQEVIFRLKHILSLGEPPRDLMGYQKLRQLTPFLHLYDSWLQSRLEDDPVKKRLLGWTAVYWLIEQLFRTPQLEYQPYFPVKTFCAIIAECDLMEEDQEEFLRHFKVQALQVSIATARQMLADPVKMVRFDEMDAPTAAECMDIVEELEKKKTKKKKTAKPSNR